MTLTSMKQIQNPFAYSAIPEFPFAPLEWDLKHANEAARNIGIDLNDEHWDAVRALHEIYHFNKNLNSRSLRKVLDIKFSSSRGMKYLYQIFPSGPVSLGCYIAGLKPPLGVVDMAEGTIQ